VCGSAAGRDAFNRARLGVLDIATGCVVLLYQPLFIVPVDRFGSWAGWV
jgi:hypothetical protein